MSNDNEIHNAPDSTQPPQASASTNSATRAQLSFLDGVSQETGVASSANDNGDKFPEKKIREQCKPLIVGNQNAVPECGVYFLATSDQKRVKIGKSRNVSNRISDLANMNGYQLVLLATVPGGYSRTEKAFHRMFSKQRRHGEWFAVDADLRDAIAGLRRGSVPAPIVVAVEQDVENDLLEKERERQDAREKRRQGLFVPKPVSTRRFRDTDHAADAWKLAGGPTFERLDEVDGPYGRGWLGTHYVGAWTDDAGRIPGVNAPGFINIGIEVLGGVIAARSPTQRLYEVMLAGLEEFGRQRDVRSANGDSARDMIRGSLFERFSWYGNKKYFFPGSSCRGCSICSMWSHDGGSADAIEELERTAHMAATATSGWRVVLFRPEHKTGGHWPSCDCYRCQPDAERHR
jgi:Meiotically Up-regulated Gene 113 (MUG113) protein